MATEYTWQVVQMDRLTSDSFVVTCHYTVTATDGNYTSSTYGTTSYTQVEGETYIPYADLTEAICVGWVQDSLGQDTVEASLQSQIDALKNPVQESGVPWTTA
jgi:hypothetical protein